MSRLVSIHETAEAEIVEAADFYDLKSPGLGSVFIDEVIEAIKKISELPESAPLTRKNIRKKTVNKFPYTLAYSVQPDEIRILAVAHQKRRLFYWRSRR